MRLFDRYRSDAVYNTRAVVQRTGVPADTFRAWERRYGVPNPPRTAGNQRLYSDRDVAMISWLRDQTQAGLTISQAVSLLKVETQASSAAVERNGSASQSDAVQRTTTDQATHADPYREYRNRIVSALVAFDTGLADRIVEEAVALISVDDVCRRILAGAMVDIGDLWERGEVGIGAEHFSSAFVMRKLASLFNLSQPQNGRGPIVAASVEGELHELGLLLSCLVLSRAGYQIVYLGANMPLDELLVVIDDLNPPVVLLSATTMGTVESLKRTVRAIVDHSQRHPTIMSAPIVGFGGRIFAMNPELLGEIGGTYLGDDPDQILATVDELLKPIVASGQ